jgi:hypothetical protein
MSRSERVHRAWELIHALSIPATGASMPPLKVFVATRRTQCHRDNDFAHHDSPELVDLARTCNQDTADSACGRGRAFTCLSSGKVTTTAEVVERDLTLVQFRNVVHRSLVAAGFNDDPELRGAAEQSADEMARIAAGWPVGTIVERRGTDIIVGAWPTSSNSEERSQRHRHQRHVQAVFRGHCERCS